MTIFRTVNKEIFIENATLEDYVTNLNTKKSIHQRIENSHNNNEFSSVICGYLFSKHKTPIELYSRTNIEYDGDIENIIDYLKENNVELIINDGLQRKCDVRRFIEGEVVTVPKLYWNEFDEKIKNNTGFTTSFLYNYSTNTKAAVNNRKFTYHDLLKEVVEEFKKSPIRINITISNFKDEDLQDKEIARLIEELNTHAQFPKNQSLINNMDDSHIKNTINNLKETEWLNTFVIENGKRKLLSGSINRQLQTAINYYIYNALADFVAIARHQNSYLTKDYKYMPKRIAMSKADLYITQIFSHGISELGFDSKSAKQLFDDVTKRITSCFDFFIKNNIYTNNFEEYMFNKNYTLSTSAKMKDILDNGYDDEDYIYKDYNLNQEVIGQAYCMYITTKFGKEINNFTQFQDLTNNVIERLNDIAISIYYNEKTVDLFNSAVYNVNIGNLKQLCTLYEIFENACNNFQYQEK